MNTRIVHYNGNIYLVTRVLWGDKPYVTIVQGDFDGSGVVNTFIK